MGEATLDPNARATDLAESAVRGDRRALARLLTAVENRTPVAEAAMRQLYPRAGKAHTVGITGPPGAGKDREADDVDVLLKRGVHDHLRRLAEAGVDDLEALVAQPPRQDLRPAVVAVETGLCDEDLDRPVGHRRIIASPRGPARPLTDGG